MTKFCNVSLKYNAYANIININMYLEITHTHTSIHMYVRSFSEV